MLKKLMRAEHAESPVQTLPFLTSTQLAASHAPKLIVGEGVGVCVGLGVRIGAVGVGAEVGEG